MSDPARNPTSPARPIERRDSSAWFMFSVALHLLVAVLLVFCTPIRDVLLEQAALTRPSSDPSLSTRELTEVAERLDRITEDHIENNVQAMHELLRQMQYVNDEEYAEYVVFEHAQIARTPEEIQDDLQQAITVMREAKSSIEADDHETGVTRQAVAMSHQEAVEDRLELVQASPEVRRAQEVASETQRRATKENERAAEAINAITDLENRLRYPENMVAEMEGRVTSAKQAVSEVEGNLKRFRDEVERAKNELTSAESNGDENAVKRARDYVKRSESAVEREQRSLENREKSLADQENRLADFKKQVSDLRQSHDAQTQTAKTAHEAALKLQNEAIERQTDVVETIMREVAERVAALETELSPDESVQPVLSETVETPSTRDMNALDLYEAARAAEEQLAQKYRQGRAMRLATLQDVPFAAALEAVDQVAPVRPELPGDALTATARNESQLEAKKEAVRTALAETSSMVSLGNALLTQAILDRTEATSGGGGPGRISLAAIEARSADQQQLEKLADEETSGRAVDLAWAMRSKEEKKEQGGNADDRPRPTSDGGAPPPIVDKSIIPVAGRKVSDTAADGARWMAVTEWHLLGPFANPGRANIDRVFPPESFVDLNALYSGKNGRPIEWMFTQTDDELGRLVPPNDEEYGIWYAYTELKFDRPRDLWITMGSDDKGRVWVNDELVWVSRNEHKNWYPDEAQRRVHFRAGRNKILFRVENGWHATAFSLWVRLAE